MSSRITGHKLAFGCSIPRQTATNSSLTVVVRAYIVHNRPKSLEELGSFQREETLLDAVKRAGMARRPDGKRYDHQRRIPHSVLQKATTRLRKASLAKAQDFDSLFAIVNETIGSIQGIGELTVYDTALRIGAKLALFSSRVYMHSGTRIGAQSLGLNWRAQSLSINEVPKEFWVLKPHEIEDCLCIFKKRFNYSIRAKVN